MNLFDDAPELLESQAFPENQIDPSLGLAPVLPSLVPILTSNDKKSDIDEMSSPESILASPLSPLDPTSSSSLQTQTVTVRNTPSPSNHEENLQIPTASAPVLELEITEKLGRGCREKHPPVRLADYIMKPPDVKSSDQVANLICEPYPSVTPYTIDNSTEIQHYKDAVLDKNWRLAVKEEVITTFSHVATMVTVRAFLQQAVNQQWEVQQMDIHIAYYTGFFHKKILTR